jgi:hypothetical protein
MNGYGVLFFEAQNFTIVRTINAISVPWNILSWC